MSHSPIQSLVDAIIQDLETSPQPTRETDTQLLKQLREFRSQVESSKNRYVVKTAADTLSRYWVDCGDWKSEHAASVNDLLDATNRLVAK